MAMMLLLSRQGHGPHRLFNSHFEGAPFWHTQPWFRCLNAPAERLPADFLRLNIYIYIYIIEKSLKLLWLCAKSLHFSLKLLVASAPAPYRSYRQQQPFEVVWQWAIPGWTSKVVLGVARPKPIFENVNEKKKNEIVISSLKSHGCCHIFKTL